MSPGAPTGNKNALKHGRYTAEAIARRQEIYGLLRAMKTLARTTADMGALMKLWDEAKAIREDYYHDPSFGLVALNRLSFEEQAREWGVDIWPSGIAANRANLERFVDDMVDQELIERPLALDELFHASTLAT